MTTNRLQFQSGLSLKEFLDQYGTEAQCEAALQKARWPSGFICPECQGSSYCIVWHGKVKTFQCNCCHTQTTLTAGTIFHATKLPLVTWFQAMCEREESTILASRVEVDDAYLGGQRSGGKVGRGSENKVPFVAAVETNEDGHPMYAVFAPVKSFCKAEISAWAHSWLASTAVVVSDGLACFRGVTDAGCTHTPQVVGKGRKSTDMACFAWVNTFLSNIKTAITGTYHSFKFEKYVYRYLAEAQYRFNRRFDLKKMLPRLLYAEAATGKRTEKWLRLTEEQR